MRALAVLAVALAALTIQGCTAYGRLSGVPSNGQKSMFQAGRKTLISHEKNVVVVAPADVVLTDDDEGLFLSVLVKNRLSNPVLFGPKDVSARYNDPEYGLTDLRVYSYYELVREELDDEKWASISAAFAGLAAGISTTNGRFSTPAGTGTYSSTTYNYGAAMAASSSLAAQNRAESEAYLQNLSASMLKKQTVLPGKWYGGVVQLELPDIETAPHKIMVDVSFGKEVHHFIFMLKRTHEEDD